MIGRTVLQFHFKVGTVSIAATILMLIVAPEVMGAGPITLQSQMGGSTFGMEISGTNAYTVEGGYLAIYDISNPIAVSPLGRALIPETAMYLYFSRIHIAGNRAYVLVAPNYSTAIHVFDVANPAAPAYLGTYQTASVQDDFAVSGTMLYLVDGAGARFYAINMATPASPVITGSLDGNFYYTLSMCLSGNTVFVGSYYGLSAVNVAVPQTPALLDSMSLDYESSNPAYPISMQYSGGRIYVSFGISSGSYEGGVMIVNAATPSALSYLGGLAFNDTTTIYDVAVKGNYLYFYTHDLLDYSYTYRFNCLGVVNIAIPAAPVLENVIEMNFHDGYNTRINGNSLWIAAGDNGIAAIDLSTPTAPAFSKYLTMGMPTAIKTAGDRVYCLGRDALYTFSSPASGTLWQTARSEVLGETGDLALNGDTVYVADGTAGIRIFNAAGGSLTPAGTVQPFDSMESVLTDKNLLFAVGSESGYGENFIIYNTTNPVSPVELGRCALSLYGKPNCMLYTGFGVQIYNYNGGVDVATSDPHNPTIANTINYPEITDVWACNGVFLAAISNALFDITSFTPLYYNYTAYINQISLRDRDVFLATSEGVQQLTGMNYFTLNAIDNPIGATPASTEYCSGVTLRGNCLYTISEKGLSRYQAPMDPVPGCASIFESQGNDLAAQAIALGLDANGDGAVNAADTVFGNWDLDRDGIADAWQLALLAEALNGTRSSLLGSIEAYLTNWSAVAEGPAGVCQEYTTLIAGLLTMNVNIVVRLQNAAILGNNVASFAPWRFYGAVALDADTDLDLDGQTNGQEAASCRALGGDAQSFVTAALTRTQHTGPVPVAGGFALVALAGTLTLIARRNYFR